MNVLTKQFLATGKQLDFVSGRQQALSTINFDVEQATKGLIPKLLEEIDPLTKVILVNAIYFKGLWAAQFDKNFTNEAGEFRKTNGQLVKVPLMFKKKKFPYYYDETTKAKLVQLDYKSGGNISMVLVLPDEGVSLTSYIKNHFTNDTILQSLDRLESFDDVNLTLPRFKVSSTHYLVPTLQLLGIREVFGPGANLSKVSPNHEQLYVSEVIQKAVIEVNEEGTEAAAATSIMMRTLMLAPEQQFRADRPFLYMLVAKHGQKQARQILFVGVVEDPTEN